MSEVVIVGGSGFIGTRLCQRLNEKKAKFYIVDKAPSYAFPEKAAIGDVRSIIELRSTIPNNAVLINLAAEHRDDVCPRSLYDDVNVGGAKNICMIAKEKGINHIVFTSTVAVYGFAPPGTNEIGKINYFNDYGRTKWLAEKIYRAWQEESPEKRTLTIVRPTVVFGEQNRGNVYNLFRQIANGKFLMIGRGENKKSMAYVENVAGFIEHALQFQPGLHIYNYVDKPDLDMNTLVRLVREQTGRLSGKCYHVPYSMGLLGGYAFDVIARITGKRLPISSIRVKKFCATTQFGTSVSESGFAPPVPLTVGIERTVRHEFVEDHSKQRLFYTE